MKFYFLLFTFLVIALDMIAQSEYDYRNTSNTFTINMSYGSNLSLGDLKDRFGSNFSLGIDLEWIVGKSSVIFGIKTRYNFGSKVKENVLSNLIGAEGQVLGVDQTFAAIFLRQRGFYIGSELGKIISFNSNRKSGLRLSLGLGYLLHWIRVQDDTQSVPQVVGPYQAGYDRLTGGLAATQFIGYQSLALNGRVNLFGGVELIEGFTKSQREINYSTRSQDRDARLDILAGFRVGIVLAFYKGSQQQDQEIYY